MNEDKRDLLYIVDLLDKVLDDVRYGNFLAIARRLEGSKGRLEGILRRLGREDVIKKLRSNAFQEGFLKSIKKIKSFLGRWRA